MRVSITNNVITVETGIDEKGFKRMYPAGYTKKDEKGNQVALIKAGDDAVLTTSQLVANNTVDGKLAVTIVDPGCKTKEAYQNKYGSAIVKLSPVAAELVEEMNAAKTAIKAAFAGVTVTATEEEATEAAE